jgi:hypothetical protein
MLGYSRLAMAPYTANPSAAVVPPRAAVLEHSGESENEREHVRNNEREKSDV